MLSVGDVVAGYRIERVLGQGGMGAVYLVANPELPRHEALKLMSVELSKDPGFRARFLREAEVAGRLAHPNIVPIHRRGETAEGQLWIAMQFIDGTDAEQECLDGRMTAQRAVHIISEVAKALDYAHHNQVIHRDVKPANFLLARQAGTSERVMLADFGIARALDDANLTGTGQMVATLAYAAPEVIAGQALGPATDQYSLACSLFRLLTGKTPFAQAGTQPAILMAHLHQAVPRISEQAPGLPQALDAIIATAMAKDPAQRYSSCTEFAAAAAAALQPASTAAWTHSVAPVPSSVIAPPPSKAQRGPRRATALTAMVSVLVVAATAIGSLTWLSHRGGNTNHTSATPPTSSTPTPSTSAAISAETLESVLLSDDELSKVYGAPLIAVGVIEDFMDDGSTKVTPDSCSSIFQNGATEKTYAGSDWTAFRKMSAKAPKDAPRGGWVSQSATLLPSVLAAQRILARHTYTLGLCGGLSGTATIGSHDPAPFDAEQPRSVGELLTISANEEGVIFQHVWSYRGPVVIEVLVMSTVDDGQAIDIANQLLTRIPT